MDKSKRKEAKETTWTTLRVPKALAWRLKAYAAKRQLSMMEAVALLIEKEMKNAGE